jgi:hypothetical protein
MKSKIKNLYFSGKLPESIAEIMDVSLGYVTKCIAEIREDLRLQRIAEKESKVFQINAIEKELFKAIKKDPNSQQVKELQLTYTTYCV